MQTWIKYLITAALVVIISEVAKRSDKAGALIGALPWMTIMVLLWLYFENQESSKIAAHAYYTFWYVLPTLPMFLLLPYLLNKQVMFGWAMLAGVALTISLFAVEVLVLRRFNINLI
ncbi:MAG: DUF3147 family protein [Gammaproteobacteria bacterium]|nr:DUF3147 family protein [Gammaproteobacteria bacterium]